MPLTEASLARLSKVSVVESAREDDTSDDSSEDDSRKHSCIYQLKVSLGEIEPQIWRRIEISSSHSFQDFHMILQRCMGWKNCHSYRFEAKNPKTGCVETIAPTPGCSDSFLQDTKNDQQVCVRDYLKTTGDSCLYIYDFSSKWEHLIDLEVVTRQVQGLRYPRCVEGAMACPPEKCGGPRGYQKMVRILKNPGHKDYNRVADWVKKFARGFSPDKFNANSVFTK